MTLPWVALGRSERGNDRRALNVSGLTTTESGT